MKRAPDEVVWDNDRKRFKQIWYGPDGAVEDMDWGESPVAGTRPEPSGSKAPRREAFEIKRPGRKS